MSTVELFATVTLTANTLDANEVALFNDDLQKLHKMRLFLKLQGVPTAGSITLTRMLVIIDQNPSLGVITASDILNTSVPQSGYSGTNVLPIGARRTNKNLAKPPRVIIVKDMMFSQVAGTDNRLLSRIIDIPLYNRKTDRPDKGVNDKMYVCFISSGAAVVDLYYSFDYTDLTQ